MGDFLLFGVVESASWNLVGFGEWDLKHGSALSCVGAEGFEEISVSEKDNFLGKFSLDSLVANELG